MTNRVVGPPAKRRAASSEVLKRPRTESSWFPISTGEKNEQV